jgi:hypothetical protein
MPPITIYIGPARQLAEFKVKEWLKNNPEKERYLLEHREI